MPYGPNNLPKVYMLLLPFERFHSDDGFLYDQLLLYECQTAHRDISYSLQNTQYASRESLCPMGISTPFDAFPVLLAPRSLGEVESQSKELVLSLSKDHLLEKTST